MNIKPLPKRKEGGSEAALDLEQQFILRLPAGPATTLREDLQSGSMSLKDKLSIELHQDNRMGIVRYGADLFNTKLVDLPCIIETSKTVDRKTFYKTGDISQIMVCQTEEEAAEMEERESPKKKDSKDKKFFWNHGITAPLKNVRKRRFRKTLKKKVNYMEQPDIEKEVRRLFRMDAEAIDVKWEVINEEEKPLNDSSGQPQSVVEASGSTRDERSLHRTDTGNSLDLMDTDMILPELSSSEDEEEKEVNIMDSDDNNANSQDTRQDYSMSESQDYMISGDAGTLEARVSELQGQLEELRDRRQALEDQAATADSEQAMDELQAAIDATLQEESEKEKERTSSDYSDVGDIIATAAVTGNKTSESHVIASALGKGLMQQFGFEILQTARVTSESEHSGHVTPIQEPMEEKNEGLWTSCWF